ncbi:unnamed protein product [Alopecurus aequalis]
MDLVVGASSDAVKSLVGKLGNLLAQEYTLIRGVGDDIQYINDELASMQAFINRTKRASSHDEQSQDWMKQVREVSYDIEDCIDDVNHRLGHEPRGTGALVYLRKKWYLLKTIWARRSIAAQIGNLKLRAQHVSERRGRYGVENLTGSAAAADADAPTDRLVPPPQLIGTEQPVGVEGAIKELGERWFHNREHEGTSAKRFLAIVGFGGLGKTTLALELYRKFGDEFDCRASVQASQKFDLLVLLRSLVKQFHEQQVGAAHHVPLHKIDEWQLEELRNNLADQLQNKRYLILIDDIWSISAWENINDSLPKSKMGGNIVVTTRFKSVAAASCRGRHGYMYEHKPLLERESCKLFSQIIFGTRENPTRAAFDGETISSGPLAEVALKCQIVKAAVESDGQVISKAHHNPSKKASSGEVIRSPPDGPKKTSSAYKIIFGARNNPSKTASSGQISYYNPTNATSETKTAPGLLKKCGGLPLAIIIVAGLVASKLRSGTSSKTLDDYLHEVDKDLSGGLGTNLTTEGVTKILDRCYNDLPASLKTCLLYLSMFPKGCFISRKRLIRRWIAEGFIMEKHGKNVEEVAEDCFNELISRNLIRAVNNSSNGKVKNYQIHDMVLEYIVSKSSDENFITIVGGHWQTPFPSYKVRRLSVHRSSSEAKRTVERMKLSHVRSLTAFKSFEAMHSSLSKFQILQVLDLELCRDLPSHQLKKICKLHQLKYLSMRQTDIDEIPSEIGNLEYLEVLDIRETKVRLLPPSIERLNRMAHLLGGNKSKRLALQLTEEITKMTTLQTLSGVEIRGSSTASAMVETTTLRTEGVQPLATVPKNRDGCIHHCQFKTTSRAWSQESFEDLEKLTNLKKLSIYILGKLSKSDKKSLLSAIEHLSSCSLKSLAIDDEFTGFLEYSLNSSKAPPEHLHSLELSGMLSKVPKWIERLHSLEKLTLSLTSLTTGGEIFVPIGGFENLKLLRFMAPILPPISFLEGAMPSLERLELKFRDVDGVHGLENLASLRQVFLTVSSKAPKAADEIKRWANKIEKSPPTVIVNEYNESSTEK